jgi:uncharacterized protein DUF4365
VKGNVRGIMKRPRVLPQRPKSHVVGDRAVDIFVAACDPAWVIAPVNKDYGLDLQIEVARGGYVTGEEFVVQVKGRASVNFASDLLPHANVRQATINYWIAKLSPTMIAVVDTTTNAVFYDWLEHCYPSYPNAVQLDGEIALPLRHSSAEHDLRKEVRRTCTGTTHLSHKTWSAYQKASISRICCSASRLCIALPQTR